MEVILAQKAGACYGVQRALDMAHAILDDGKAASTLGPLIHNPQVVCALEEAGLHVAREVDDITGDAVVIRSHGVPPEVMDALTSTGIEVVDATCPHVARAQKAARELASDGCRVLVLGEAGHPEVEGLMAYARREGAAVDVVLAPEDIPDDLYEPVGVVVQTTQTNENLMKIVEALQARGIDPIVKDTICAATRQRQTAAEELAATVDAMVVIGGRNSSNTTRLAEICEARCPRTFHIESADELACGDFEGCAVVGVTAGASTPADQIASVMERLAWL